MAAWGWRPSDPFRLILCLAALALVLLIGVRASRPPSPLPVTAPATAFSAARAMKDVEQIAVSPHPTGTAENAFVAKYLGDRLEAMGLHVERPRYLVDDETRNRLLAWSGGTLSPSELQNVVGVLPGRDRSLPAVLLMAHYDTVWGSPGAADDGAGVASILEIVRALRARGRPLHDVAVVFTDGEEEGLSGARAFWDGTGLAGRVGAMLNFEARGAGGRATMFETGEGNGAMMTLFAHAVKQPVANSAATLVYRLMPNSTDYTVARQRGIAGFNYAFTGRAAYYHSPRSTPATLDPGSVQDMGRQALDLVAALAAAPALPPKADNATFFDVLSWFTVRYPLGRGWLVIAVAALAIGGAWWRARPPVDAIGAGAGVGLWGMAMAAIGLALVNAVSGADANPDYYDRLAALPRLEAQAWLTIAAVLLASLTLRGLTWRLAGVLPPLLLALLASGLGAPSLAVMPPALLAAALWAVMPRAGAGAWGGWIGLAGLVLFLAVVMQVAAPEAAWLYAWPALVVGLVLLAAGFVGRARPILALAALGTVIVATPLLPPAHFAMLTVGADLPQVLALTVPVLLAACWPLARMRGSLVTGAAIAALLVGALGIALTVRLDRTADTVPAYDDVRTPAAPAKK